MNNRLTTSEHVQLWEACRTGSRDAFSQLYDLFASDLYRYGYNLVRNKPLVEDCLHELFLHIYENRHRLGATDNIRFYLYRALRRRLLDTVNRLTKLSSEEYQFNQADFFILPYEQVLVGQELAKQQSLVIQVELNKLPKRQKEILYLVYMKGLTYQQAAEVMDITLKTVYNTLNVALTSLRTYVRKSLQKLEAL
ncbi:sigma-70 family RNA polymerase sigma factor [Spirosoma sp. HMF3257]|uniref:Sigma-70 family RNA polymerase sigma factor n=1 Tax=Spirosoma telluris TaxID=2183553 RepID=A0A327NEH0_9BACT|nr:sigma-70 family RNA polymerase sigma factor [Spirosoma telluris]RAI73507.1 sigma-70 family RNA polymerase sigma factor [Spirosoma telluris]